MQAVLVILLVIILIYLALEQRRALGDRAKLRHVVHVNGIRGKSTTTRLIDAGLRAGGWKVFCKTTGTVPMTIGVDNVARPLFRRGRANINEQLRILHRAAEEGAEVLVLECMAVDPKLQNVAQHRMVRGDVGVITNVRLDHTAEMGETLEEICDSLSNTIPRDGILFTADGKFAPQLRRNGEKIGCETVLALPDGSEPDFDFPENVALALAVCERLGVERSVALEGMLHYQRDPYALSLYKLPNGCVFINGMSINDPQSTEMVCRRVMEKYGWEGRELLLVINNRPDRGYRTEHMAMVAKALAPGRVWLLGASQMTMERRIRRDVSGVEVLGFRKAEELPLEGLNESTVVFAVGNVAGPGHALMKRIREEAVEDVS